MKKIFIYTIIALSGLLLTNCEDVLEKENLTAITPHDVWNNEALSRAYINRIYAALMPGMPMSTGNNTDEAGGGNSPYLLGTATIDSYNYWPYSWVLQVNHFLENIDTGTLPDEVKTPLKGEALFWRAWMYFNMVKAYGGVPLILNSQDPFDIESLKVERNRTSEVIAQIIKDLDDAIEALPTGWDTRNIGRIDKVAAKAFKARVLLFYASPQFNPENIVSRWQDVYDASKEAKEYAESQGKGLYEDFGGIWDNELNKEVIMVRRYNDPGSVYFSGGVRPLRWSQGAAGWDQPSLELVEAFPLVDGTPWDPSTMNHETIHRNRSERFYATIAYNGAAPYLPEMFEENTNLWTYRTLDGGYMDGDLPSATSFYRKKAVDKTISETGISNTTTDWPEIRFAEVLMIFGEAANEIGNSGEALQVLYDIRSRAGIMPGNDNRFGITASTQEEIRAAFMNENYIEFAFENKRWDQLRRLRQLDTRFNSIQYDHGLRIYLKEGEYGPDGMDDVDDYIDNFIFERVNVTQVPFDVKPEYYFYAIPRHHLEQNPNLEQTIGWPEGTFDPLL